jgi:hypothetical protein
MIGNKWDILSRCHKSGIVSKTISGVCRTSAALVTFSRGAKKFLRSSQELDSKIVRPLELKWPRKENTHLRR